MYKGRDARLLFDLTRIYAGRYDRRPMAPASLPTKIRFDSFELDVTSGELRKGVNRLRLQPQPFRVLLLLIERTGQVVTREEIQRCLWKDSAVEFQKILDHSGIVWNCWTGALAHLGVARANALEARTSQGADADAARVRALAAYKDFLTLWKDADPDIPLLKQAKAEYAKLQ